MLLTCEVRIFSARLQSNKTTFSLHYTFKIFYNFNKYLRIKVLIFLFNNKWGYEYWLIYTVCLENGVEVLLQKIPQHNKVIKILDEFKEDMLDYKVSGIC